MCRNDNCFNINRISIITTLLLILSVSLCYATEKERVWIYFKDKGQIESKNIAEIAKQHLSQKSIKRRAKISIHVKYDYTDLPLNNNYVNKLKKSGVQIIHKSKWLNAVSAFIEKDQYKSIISLEFIKKIVPVKSFTFVDKEASEGISLNKSTNLDYGDSYTQNKMHGISIFHNHNYNGSGVLIAMFDTGFKTSHSAFDTLNVLLTRDFVEGDNDVTGAGENHGTQTLGVIAGYSPGDLIGPAYGADFILAKTDDYYTETQRDEDNWVAAAEWADSLGADIISSSVGYNWFDKGEYDYTYKDMDGNTAITTIAADLAVKKGIAVFNSAGNEGNNSWQHILAPADGDSVFAIGNITSTGVLSPTSSIGPTSDGRIKPDFVAMGTNVRTVSVYNNDSFTSKSGTSFSAPLAAGAGALVLCYNDSLAPMQLYGILKKYASNKNNPNNDIGYGSINIAPILGGSGSNQASPINISRNPFSDYVKISLDYLSDKTIVIYNSLGQKVKSFDKNNINFTWFGVTDNNRKVSSGVYFISMIHNNEMYSKKIVLIR